MEREQWVDVVNERLREAFKAARGKRSLQEIADATAKLGYPMSRQVLTNFTTGRKRSLDVPELMVLAAACGVPPVALLFGTDLPDGDIEVLPGEQLSASDALAWVTGEQTPDPVRRFVQRGSGQITFGESTSELGRLIELTRDRWAKEVEHANALFGLAYLADRFAAGDKRGEGFDVDAVLEVTNIVGEIEELNRRITDIGGTVAAKKTEEKVATTKKGKKR